MDSNNIKLFVRNYIKEPILYPLKDIKNIFIGAIMLFLCLIVQIIAMLITSTDYPDAISQSIILFLVSLPFFIFIYGYVGLVIKNTLDNNSLPSWKNLKSIILIGVKINTILLFVLLIIFIAYFIKSSSMIYAYRNIYDILWIFYYPAGWYNFIDVLIYLMHIIFSLNKYLFLILVIPITILLILNAIANEMKNILNLRMIKKLLSVEYFGVLFIVLIYFLISNVMYLIYAYMSIIDFDFPFTLGHYFILSALSLEDLTLEFIRKFLQFYFLVVIGRTLGNYAKKAKM